MTGGTDQLTAKKTTAKKTTAKKTPAKKTPAIVRGGARRGAGRPAGVGTGTNNQSRINRVVAMLTEDENKLIGAWALKQEIPIGTAAYRLLMKGLTGKARASTKALVTENKAENS